ncbi:hypothetical protein [Nocardia bhagyanarayanae]|uniref:Secreted protein n=1 Tax=Nocardia bhagyanarayanae TaxID=1215925 RepID=A0A543EXL8_9NOCA|nr:hypothetical protein [Nocardia bhagyanarayanae]TQM26294.1 hypothetical protein FB390_6480 [Nocardia bhagyanarayanae]
MRQRLTFGLGVASVVMAAAGILAPQAVARELAPGLSCEGYSCRNDTDDTYRVESVVTCSDGVGQITVVTYARPQATTDLRIGCPTKTIPGQLQQQPPVLNPDGPGYIYPPPTMGPPQVKITHPVLVEHRSAVVDNSPRQEPTGSAG